MDSKLACFTVERWASAFFRRKKNVVFTTLTCLLLVLIFTRTSSRRGRPDPIAPVPARIKLEERAPTDAADRVKKIVLGRNKQPLHVRKQLSELESFYYYDDGRVKDVNQNNRSLAPFQDYMEAEDSDQGQAKLIAEKHLKNPRTGYGPTSKCDLSKLHENDTNVQRDLDPCEFRNISGDPIIDQKINSLSSLDLPLLLNYRNPCWYERLPEVNEYRNKVHMFWWQVKESFDRLWPIMEDRRKHKHLWRLRCLPMIYVIGLSHCGASDLVNILLRHPLIVKGATREPYYWDRNRWLLTSRFSNYLDLFDEAAEQIRQKYSERSFKGKVVTYHPMVTLEGSVHYLTDFLGIDQVAGNKDQSDPVHLLPSVLRNLTPKTNIRILVAIRNPTERVFVSYGSFDPKKDTPKSAQEFHDLVTDHIDRINQCLAKHSLRLCLYDKSVTRTRRKVDVHVGIYHGYIRDWIHVFPEMQVVRWEDFSTNRSHVFREAVREVGLYLEPKYLPSDAIQEQDPDPGFKMMEQTRQLLDKFYRPYNDKLDEILKNDKFAYR